MFVCWFWESDVVHGWEAGVTDEYQDPYVEERFKFVVGIDDNAVNERASLLFKNRGVTQIIVCFFVTYLGIEIFVVTMELYRIKVINRPVKGFLLSPFELVLLVGDRRREFEHLIGFIH